MTEPSPRGATELRLAELEFDRHEGSALARFVSELRARVAGGERLILHECPQMLAHTLYKANLLGSGTIELASVRDEEPYG